MIDEPKLKSRFFVKDGKASAAANKSKQDALSELDWLKEVNLVSASLPAVASISLDEQK